MIVEQAMLDRAKVERVTALAGQHAIGLHDELPSTECLLCISPRPASAPIVDVETELRWSVILTAPSAK